MKCLKCFVGLFAVLALALPCVAQEEPTFSAETNFRATDFLIAQSSPQFVVEGLYFYWDGDLSVFDSKGELEISEFVINQFGNIEFTASTDDATEGTLSVRGTIGSSINGRAWLEVDIYTDRGILAQSKEQLVPGFAWVVVSQLCECDDGITLTCTNSQCQKGEDCPNGTGQDKCYMKLPILEFTLVPPAFTIWR